MSEVVINLCDAKGKLSSLVERAAAGEEISSSPRPPSPKSAARTFFDHDPAPPAGRLGG